MKSNKISLVFCKADLITITGVILLAIFLGIWFSQNVNYGEHVVAVIYRNGQRIQEISLEDEKEIVLTYEYTNLIQVKEKVISIVESDCPGKDCVHSRGISRGGQSLVCLPNRVEIRLEGREEVDFILR